MTQTARDRIRGSADPIGDRDDDPFGFADLGHAPGVLVLGDPANESVSSGGQAGDFGLQGVDLEAGVVSPQHVPRRVR